MLEELYEKNEIELKFIITVLEMARNNYKKDKFEKIIGQNYADIKLASERLISFLYEENL